MKHSQLNVSGIQLLLEKGDFGVVIIDYSENLRFISEELMVIEKMIKEVAEKKNKIVKIYHTDHLDPNRSLVDYSHDFVNSKGRYESRYFEMDSFNKGEKILFVSPLDSYCEYNSEEFNNINKFFICLQTVGVVDVLVMAPQRMWTKKLLKLNAIFSTDWGATPGFTPSADSMNIDEPVNGSPGAISTQGQQLLMAAISPVFVFDINDLRSIRIHLELLGFPVDIGTEIEVLEKKYKFSFGYFRCFIMKTKEKIFARKNFNTFFDEKTKKELIGFLKKQKSGQDSFNVWVDDLIARRMMRWPIENKREKLLSLFEERKIKAKKEEFGELCRLDPDLMDFFCEYFFKK